MNELVWIYMINAAMLSVHEMDSAYWHEWDLFGLKGGINGFLVIHIPLFVLIFYGFWMLIETNVIGFCISLLLAVCGIGAFVIHMTFLRKGHHGFDTFVSKTILSSILIVSIVQGVLTLLNWNTCC
ncbi:MAG: DUF6713 family protein [candidate division KSB1 bacterium]|nr:DUF6713 family protein [candidate division KSB1 bacterium]